MSEPHPSFSCPVPVIGSQLFINRTTSPEEASLWVDRMAEANFKLIRLFMIWDFLEPEAGNWVFDTYDAVFDQAEERGLQVVPTLMSVSPPGWMLRSGGVQAVADLEDPEVLRLGEDYIRQVVGRWKDHPALHSWILWNEASRIPPRTPSALSRYRDFLRRRFHGDPEAMNRLQFRQYTSFDDVGKTNEGGAMELEFATFAENVFWLEFSVEELCGHLKRIAGVVRELDMNHPVHVNPHGLSFFVQHAGQSIWKEADTVDFLGCSSHPVWHSIRYPRDRWGRSLGIFADLMRSSTPHPAGEFWVSELQGGMTHLSGMISDTPSPQELTRWMWEGIAAGARATVFWCFNWRDEGFEAGEWSLARFDGSPSPRLEAASSVAETLETHGELFGPSRPWTPDVVMLRSDAAERLAHAERHQGEEPDNPRNHMRVADAASGAALLLADLDVETGYVEEEGLEALLAGSNGPKLIVAPGLEALQEGTLERLREYVHAGGHLVADGPFGLKDPVGRIASHRFPLWKELFGGAFLDVETWGGCTSVPEDRADLTGWWLKVVSDPAEDSVRSAWEDGCPMVWSHAYGSGSATMMGTWFFHRFLIGGYPDTRAWFAAEFQELLPETSVKLSDPGPGLRLRRLRHPDGILGVVISEHDQEAAQIRTDHAATLWTADGVHRDVRPEEPIELLLDANGIGFFLLRSPSQG